jgi:hypothetical protein
MHADVSAEAPVCVAFLQGECTLGPACKDKHFTVSMLRHYAAHPAQYEQVLVRSKAAVGTTGAQQRPSAMETNRGTGAVDDDGIDSLLCEARDEVETARRIAAVRPIPPPAVYGAGYPFGKHPRYRPPPLPGRDLGDDFASSRAAFLATKADRAGAVRMPAGDLPDAYVQLESSRPDLCHVGGLLFVSSDVAD